MNNSTIDAYESITYGQYSFYLTQIIITIFGILTTSINIIVFLSPKLKDRIFRYFLISSLIEMLYFLILIVYYVINAFEIHTYQALNYLIAGLYITVSCAIFINLLNILISVERLCIFMNKKCLKKISYKWLASFLAMFSFGICSSSIFNVNVVLFNDLDYYLLYKKVDSDFYKSNIGKVLEILNYSLRIFLSSIALTIINAMLIYIHNKWSRKKRRMSRRAQPSGI